MQISKDMCGFTGGQADTLRKAIGKKKRDTMAKMKAAFVEGMIEHSKVKRDFAEKFWASMEAFADYCFNKVARRLLCPDRLPDGLSESPLSGSLHGGPDDQRL